METPLPPGIRMSKRKSLTRALSLTIIGFILFLYSISPARINSETKIIHLNFNESQTLSLAPASSGLPIRDCTPNVTHLQELKIQYGLGDAIDYAKRYVRFQPQLIARHSITKVGQVLLPNGFAEIKIDTPAITTTQCLEPLEVPVPISAFPRSVNGSSFLFGISTTYSRLRDPQTRPMAEWAHWLTDGMGNSNGAGLIIRLVDATEKELAEIQYQLVSLGVDAKVYSTDSQIEMAERYLYLLPALYSDISTPNRKWLVLCDDDTFFPSMQRLIDQLSLFDSSEPLYIGTFSEDVNNIQRHGSQAFGGAGVFFTVPLAAQISNLIPQCSTRQKIDESNTGWGPQGDILLRKCIYENTEVRLTMLRDLHQLDIMGDPSGFYESGLAPLSLHHFKGGMWHKANPYAGVQIIHTCGEDCFLQRFQTADNYIISNGYSVALYPHGINFNVNQMERTFGSAPDDYGWNLDFMLGPGRISLLGSGRKVAWEIQEAMHESDGSVRQVYIRRANDERWTRTDGEYRYPMMERDGVLELVWIP